MQKVILKTAIKTLVAVLIALILAFGIASLGFPQSMADICAKCGNYRFATSYASLRYTYTHSVDDLDVCARYSILSGHDGNIDKFCGQLVSDEGFEGICEKQTSVDYKQYIYGNLSAAKYRCGEKAAALQTAQTAMTGVDDFPKNNAFVYLTLAIRSNPDKEIAQTLLAEINSKTPTADQQKSYNAVKNILREITEEE